MELGIYVGTYAKYNSGSIAGAWLDTTDYADRAEFYEACRDLHSDEDDAELMFQDYDGAIMYKLDKMRFVSECHVSPEIWEFIDHFGDDEEQFEAFVEWSAHVGGGSLESFESAFVGSFDSLTAYAEHLFEEEYLPCIQDKYLQEFFGRYFDAKSYAHDLDCNGYMSIGDRIFAPI